MIYYKLIIILSLLFSYPTIQSMQLTSLSTREKATIGIIITGFLVTTYGFYKILDWFYSKQAESNSITRTHNRQVINKIISTNGSIILKQGGSKSDENPKACIEYKNGDFSIDQTGNFDINNNQSKQNGLQVNELAINLPATMHIQTIVAHGIGKLLLYKAYSSQEQKIKLTSEVTNSNFLLTMENKTLNYTFVKNSSIKTIPLLEVWICNTNNIRLDLGDSIEGQFAK